MRKAISDADCADCLCRVCARSEYNDAYNAQVEKDKGYCEGCNACSEEVIETEEDCPRGEFLPDEDDMEVLIPRAEESRQKNGCVVTLEWRDVNTNPPKEPCDCLVVANGEVEFACCGFNLQGVLHFDTPDVFEPEEIKGVTHWMPKPPWDNG